MLFLKAWKWSKRLNYWMERKYYLQFISLFLIHSHIWETEYFCINSRHKCSRYVRCLFLWYIVSYREKKDFCNMVSIWDYLVLRWYDLHHGPYALWRTVRRFIISSCPCGMHLLKNKLDGWKLKPKFVVIALIEFQL